MSNKISKISKLKNIESFLQINFLKGFQYIDNAGKIINKYQSNTGEVLYNMSPDRLLIYKPTSDIEELKISNVDFWMHYVSPRNLGETLRTYIKETEEILKIIEVDDILRIGWRNYFVFELINNETDLNKLSKISQAAVQSMFLRTDFDKDTKLTTNIKLLQRKDNKNKKVIMFDMDLYQEKKVDLQTAVRSFSMLKTYFESDKTLQLINEIIALLK